MHAAARRPRPCTHACCCAAAPQELEAELAGLRQELAAARELAARASGTWDRFRKERDFHRMHHKRVAQEKNRLITDVKRLKVRVWLPCVAHVAAHVRGCVWLTSGQRVLALPCKLVRVACCHPPLCSAPMHPLTPLRPRMQAHYAKYEPTILELKRKYEAAMKEKMLSGLERDKLAAKVCVRLLQVVRSCLRTWAGRGDMLAAGARNRMCTPDVLCAPARVHVCSAHAGSRLGGAPAWAAAPAW
jgi:hypothetical protein